MAEYEGRLPNAQAVVTLPGLAPNGQVDLLGERLTPHPFPGPQRSLMDISLPQMCDREACRGKEAVDAGISKTTRLWSSQGSLHCRLNFFSHSSSPRESIPRRAWQKLLALPRNADGGIEGGCWDTKSGTLTLSLPTTL